MPDVHGVTVVIPARYGSSRFPGKPLIPLAGKPLIQHVAERAAQSRGVTQVIVATDDERIAAAVRSFGGTVLLVNGPYRTGTDRVAAVARQVPGRYFVNLQGDEIPLHRDLLADLTVPFPLSGAAMGTLMRRMEPREEVRNPAMVKVAVDARGEALYFSRSAIPCVRDGWNGAPVEGLHYLHLGIYAFTRDALLQFADWPTGRLEDAEKLEQLRALEQGMAVRVWETRHSSLRIDTPDDIPEAERTLTRAEAPVAR